MNLMIAAFLGRRGRGKSSLAYYHARRLNLGVFIYDSNAQFGVGKIVSSIEDLYAAIEEDVEGPIVYRPADVEEEFTHVAQAVWGCKCVSFLIDESSLLQSPQSIHPALDRLIRLGRDCEISVFMTQHRPRDLNGIATSLATDLFFFHTTNPLDLERIERDTNGEVRRRVEQLSGFDYLHFNLDTEEFYVNTDSDSWKVSIKPKRASDSVEEVSLSL